MATFVFVHGGNIATDTWNRLTGRNTYPPGGLLGGRCWEGTVAYLADHGHSAVAPTLPDEYTHNLTDHVRLVCAEIKNRDLRQVILVGHSYGGMVITGVADALPDRIRHLVYVDAALPDPGQSLFDLFAKGGVDPRSVAGLDPASAYIEKLRFDPRELQGLKKTYILCTESDFIRVTRIARQKIVTDGEGWTYLELPASHVPMATMPVRFNRLMLAIANR